MALFLLHSPYIERERERESQRLPNLYHQIPRIDCDGDSEVKYIIAMGRKRADGEMRSLVKNRKRKAELGKINYFRVIVCLLIIVIV